MQNINYSGQYYNNHNYNIKIRTGDDIANATGDAICGEFMIAKGGEYPGLYVATKTSGDDFEIYRVSEISSANKFFDNRYSLSFDGTDDYVTMSNPTSLNFAGSFTISLWVMYTNVSSSFNFLVDKSTDVTTRQYSLYLRDQITGTKTFSFYGVDSGGNQQFLNSTGSIAVNTWNHVAVVCNSGVTDGTKLYINGVAETLGTFTVVSNASAPFQLGKRSDNSFLHQGLMDEVAVFDSALAASDIASIYNNGTPADISTLNPVGWWRMGDDNAGAGTTITDQGSGGNDGTLVNGPTFSTSVPITNTYSVNFDGVDDYIQLPNSTDFEASEFTWSAWFYCGAIDRENTIVDASYHTASFFGYHLRVKSDNRLRFSSYHSFDQIDSTTTVSANTWYHVVATHESGSDKLYVNGSLEASGNASSFSVSDASNLRLGTHRIFNTFHQGLIDEVSFFNSSLTESDIASIYNEGTPNDISSLEPVSWWRMGDDNAGAGTTITDQGSGGNDGTLVNGPTFSTDVPS